MATSTSTKTPVYFVSHGGPNIMYETQHPVYSILTGVGKEIVQKVRPKAVVVISAHWESSFPGVIEINSAEKTDLIYDFYGFPSHYYKHQYPNKGHPALAQKISSLLSTANIKSRLVTRGLDHGVFACFSVLFPPSSENALFPDIPLVQVSLPYQSNNPENYFALGKALQSLREEGVTIICSGMAVHNLREHFRGAESGKPLAFAKSFDDALNDAVVGTTAKAEGQERQARMRKLLERADARRAHPSWEHLWPVFVAAGAADEPEKAKRIWTSVEGGMSWAIFRFGSL